MSSNILMFLVLQGIYAFLNKLLTGQYKLTTYICDYLYGTDF